MTARWDDAGIIITGAGSGIGKATAIACARLGARVAALDLDARSAEATAAEAGAEGAAAVHAGACDVREEDQVADAVAAAASAMGPITGCAASAGIEREALPHELELAGWDDVIATNLTGTFLTCKHVLRQMLDHGRGGSIVCFSSILAHAVGPGGVAAYAASKAGVSGFVRSLAVDYAPHGIRVNAIVPGTTDTPMMWRDVPAEDLPEHRANIEQAVVMGRIGAASEVAAGIVWLLGPESSYVTGSHLAVDGGVMATSPLP